MSAPTYAESASRRCVRIRYETTRRKAREQAGKRTDRGLPHHPDGSGFASCPRCECTGVIDHGHWHPEMWTSSTCSLCCGSGFLDDGYRDPLLRLRDARKRRNRLRDPEAYRWLRLICAAPSWDRRLRQTAVLCEVEARRAVVAWREVA